MQIRMHYPGFPGMINHEKCLHKKGKFTENVIFVWGCGGNIYF